MINARRASLSSGGRASQVLAPPLPAVGLQERHVEQVLPDQLAQLPSRWGLRMRTACTLGTLAGAGATLLGLGGTAAVTDNSMMNHSMTVLGGMLVLAGLASAHGCILGAQREAREEQWRAARPEGAGSGDGGSEIEAESQVEGAGHLPPEDEDQGEEGGVRLWVSGQ